MILSHPSWRKTAAVAGAMQAAGGASGATGEMPSWANLDQGDLAHIERDLTGRCCRMQTRGSDWILEMSEGRSIALAIPWRIIAEGHIALGSRDNGGLFGLGTPLDGKIEARLLLGGRRLERIFITPGTADLSLQFHDGTRLDAFNDSSGYEGWRMRCLVRGRWVHVIGSGGGQTRVIFLDN